MKVNIDTNKKDMPLTDKELVEILQQTADTSDNLLSIICSLAPGDSFKGRLLTVAEFVAYIYTKYERVISDATVRALLVKNQIDGLYKRDSTNIKYIVLLTEKTKQYKPRKYNKAK